MSKKECTQIIFDYSCHNDHSVTSTGTTGNGNYNIGGSGRVTIDNRTINITNTRIVNNARNNVRKNTVALGIGDSVIQSLRNMLTGGK